MGSLGPSHRLRAGRVLHDNSVCACGASRLLLHRFLHSLFLLRPLSPAPPRTHMLTFGISFLWFALLFVVLIFWATSTFVLSLDDQLSSVHLKNVFLIFSHRSPSLLFFFSALHDFIDHYHPPHFSCFTLFIDFFRVVIVCAPLSGASSCLSFFSFSFSIPSSHLLALPCEHKTRTFFFLLRATFLLIYHFHFYCHISEYRTAPHSD